MELTCEKFPLKIDFNFLHAKTNRNKKTKITALCSTRTHIQNMNTLIQDFTKKRYSVHIPSFRINSIPFHISKNPFNNQIENRQACPSNRPQCNTQHYNVIRIQSKGTNKTCSQLHLSILLCVQDMCEFGALWIASVHFRLH